jgi:hypothetical protein
MGADMTSPEPTLPRPILPRPAPLHGPTTATTFLVGATCLVGVLDAWSAWHRHTVGADYVAGAPGVWVADLTSVDGTGRTIGLLYVITMLASGGALLVWLSRVRTNMRLLGGRAHARRTGWVLGGWYASSIAALVLTYLLRVEATMYGLGALAAVDTVSVALQCGAGALVVVLVRQVTRWQSVPHPVSPLPPA